MLPKHIVGILNLCFIPLFMVSSYLLYHRRHLHPIDGRFPMTILSFNVVLCILFVTQGIDAFGVVPCWIYCA
jgi:hypothetical protein